MKQIIFIALKEFKSYFASPVGYIVGAFYCILSGWKIINTLFYYSNESLRFSQATQGAAVANLASRLNIDGNAIQPILWFSCLLILFLFPAITMKLFAEEKRSGSLELLLTSPLSLTEIILGKFFGALLFVLLLLSYSFLAIGFLYFWSHPELPITLVGVGGIFLFTAAIISLGIFSSCLTDSQIIAFFISLGMALFLFILSWISFNTDSSFGEVAEYFSILPHLIGFLRGIIAFDDIMYFITFIGLFLYLSYRKLEMARWR